MSKLGCIKYASTLCPNKLIIVNHVISELNKEFTFFDHPIFNISRNILTNDDHELFNCMFNEFVDKNKEYFNK